ncbi:MAG: hypothetical protein B7C24_16745 [Bacteroidetes bacterium 4572_77]|nr:MAG: hypothetical protein B7C24_16745 [Bacteroidetes bacterium 4572_77]
MMPQSQHIITLFKKTLPLVLVFSFVLFSPMLWAQNKTKLHNQISQLEKEISYTNEILKETREHKDVSIIQIKLLSQQIKKQERLINKLQQEIQILNHNIDNKQLSISKKEKELLALKEEYAKMIVYSRKNLNSYNRMMFVFASTDFNQAFKRLKYFEQYSDYRKKQVQIINLKQDSLQVSIDKLQLLKHEKESFRRKEENEKSQLGKRKINQQRGLNKLKGKESQLKKDLKKKDKQKKKLKKKIEQILAAEALKAKESKMTPDEVMLSKGFDKNKGHLPWPVEKGVVFSSFGEHAHPVLKGIKIRNDGIDIVTQKGGKARAIFKGEVRSIISVPGSANFAVLIKHGKFFSLYSNLEEVFVKPGDIVQLKQDIGKIALDPEDHTTKLQFQIWKSTNKMNPVQWLAR